MSSVFTPLLKALNLASPALDSEERPSKKMKSDEPIYTHILMNSSVGGGERQGPDVIKAGLLKALFEAAASEKSVEVSRRKVYKLWREEGGDDDEE
jgi:ribosomal RNA-processing protein 1